MDIFIGYKSEDRDRVRRLAAALGDLGYSVFWDQSIPPGSTWRQTIGRALEESRLVIICWSKATLDGDAAKWVLDEADEAVRTKKPMVPVRLDAVAPPMGHRQIQALDLSGWNGDKRDPAFAELHYAISASLAGVSIASGGISRARSRKGRAPFWIAGLLAAAGGGFAAGQFPPFQSHQAAAVPADETAIAGLSQEVGLMAVESVYPFDTRVLDDSVALAVSASRRTQPTPPGGQLMGGMTRGVGKVSPSRFAVCVEFADGTMFEGDVIRREQAEATGGDPSLLELSDLYEVTGFGVVWRRDGTVNFQGMWEDGSLVFYGETPKEFAVSSGYHLEPSCQASWRVVSPVQGADGE